MRQTTEKRSRLMHFGGWVAELVLVFVSVYAAFWLNYYQQHCQEAKRRDQILASLEQTLREGIENGKINGAKEEQQAAEFQSALDVETLTALRNDESVIRWGLSRMTHYQKLSDELIVPNLDQDTSFFYDPATKKLRKRFEMYSEALQATVKFAHDLDRTHTELLKRIQVERQHR